MVLTRWARVKHRRGLDVPMPPSGPPRRNPVWRCRVVPQEVRQFQSTIDASWPSLFGTINERCPPFGPSIGTSSRSSGDTAAGSEICRSVW